MPLLPSKDPLIRPALRTISALIVLQIGITFARLVAWRVAGTHSWFPGMNLLTSAGVALSYLWMNHLRWSAKLERSAMTDPLTGLSNRRAVELFGVRDLEIATRKRAPSSALMLDLDLFKQVNDRLGHSAGDASLCAVANALAATIRPDDMAARLGGDEFFLLLPGTDSREAASIAARVQAAIGAIRLTAPSGEIFTVSASIGSATLTSEHVTLHDLQHVSDAALYREKQRRRSQREFLALETLPGENGIRPTAQ
jgi:diguanylate cyclase (GGDEF)-like protein